MASANNESKITVDENSEEPQKTNFSKKTKERLKYRKKWSIMKSILIGFEHR